jgi:hypothetical protein
MKAGFKFWVSGFRKKYSLTRWICIKEGREGGELFRAVAYEFAAFLKP